MRRAPLTLVGAVLVLGACDAGPDQPGVMYMPEMVVSTPYDAHDRNPILARGMTLQAPPEGAIPQGYAPYHYGPGPEEATAAGGVHNPLTATEVDLARGRVVFDTFCAVCHGATGAGDGPVVPPFPNPPALTSDHSIGLSDGRIYHVITRGQGFMPAYATQVHAADRWRAVLYVRSLQGEPRAVPALAPAAAAPVEPAPSPEGGPHGD
jgi:mono/diheme cytochrome c family protein